MKFQLGLKSWNFNPGWKSPYNQPLKVGNFAKYEYLIFLNCSRRCYFCLVKVILTNHHFLATLLFRFLHHEGSSNFFKIIVKEKHYIQFINTWKRTFVFHKKFHPKAKYFIHSINRINHIAMKLLCLNKEFQKCIKNDKNCNVTNVSS